MSEAAVSTADNSGTRKVRHEVVALTKTIGTRMKEARELAGISQSDAARRLGYKNSAKLSKIENASDGYPVPILTIWRAAMLYEVSVDFLFGQSDDWERSARMTQERRTSAWLFDVFEDARRCHVAAMQAINNRQEASMEINRVLCQSIADVVAALSRYRELNQDFDDTRASSVIAGAVERAEAAVRYADAKRRKEKFVCDLLAGRVAGASKVQLGFDL